MIRLSWRLHKLTENVDRIADVRSCMAEAIANQINERLVPVVVASQNATIDPKSLYCLSASDHPELLFDTNPLKENGESYFTWRRNMLNALVAKNKAGFINGRIEKQDVNSRDFESWVQCNAIVLSWITNALNKELQERFTQGLVPRVYELKRSIALLKQEKAPTSTYYGRLKAIWNELQALNPVPICACGCPCRAAKKNAIHARRRESL
ncbi:hypothetical protein RJ639_000552 [Escallonia herrerae]|uniref:Retrotransposon Copia-like N-terminal domain-containing protein n=1 Tax=Escallonia herrerae TaxID=1293975 RepID=A0AA88XJS1_9ASTE|nr:hypothetical protein RJ639_000552 [Escallonia herrerae]